MAGKPHLGTDRLIRILQAFRAHLTALGVKIHFGTCATGLQVQHDRVIGVNLKGTTALACGFCVAYCCRLLHTVPHRVLCGADGFCNAHGVWYRTAHAVWHIRHGTYNMAMHYGACRTINAVWHMQFGTRSMPDAAWYLLSLGHPIRHMQYGRALNMQFGTCALVHTAWHIQYGTSCLCDNASQLFAQPEAIHT